MNRYLENISLKTTIFLFVFSIFSPIIFLILFLTLLDTSSQLMRVMAFIPIILVFVCLFLIIPMRYLLREKMMKNLADEFNLSFSTNSPRFFEIIMPWAWFKYHGSMVNNIRGMLDNYNISISDVLFAKSILWFILNKNPWQYTVINIKEETNDEEYQAYKTGKMPVTLKPVFSLRKILKEIQNKIV